MDSLEERAASALKEHAERYRQAGFEVLVEPRGESIPAFLRGFEPDLVATSSGKGNFVVEMKAGKQVAPGAWERLAKVVENQPGWHFELVLLVPEEGSTVNSVNESTDAIERILGDAKMLVENKQMNAALLIAWAAFESAARHQLAASGSVSKVVAPQAAIKQLVHLGALAQSDVSRLTEILQRRNAVAHGFSATVDAGDVEALSHACRQLLPLTAHVASGDL